MKHSSFQIHAKAQSGCNFGKRFALCLLFLMFTCSTALADRQITDMLGRTITVPDKITRVYASSPPATLMTYALDPDLLIGLNKPISPKARPFIKTSTANLPIIGGWFGNGKTANMETIMSLHPDIVLAWIWQSGGMSDKMVKTLEPLGIPVVCIVLDQLPDYPNVLTFLGKLFHLEERGQLLADSAQRALDEIAHVTSSIPDQDRVSVYYAENADGLNTECDKSMHAELITVSAGKNVHQCSQRARVGLQKISIEQVLNYNPEVIVFHDLQFAEKIRKDSKWSSIKAVQNDRLYQVPTLPFNWFDRPPSFMRLLGVKWLTHALYPSAYPVDMVAETQEFFQLFLGVDLDRKQAQQLLHL